MAEGGEVGGDLAVEECELLELGAGEPLEACAAGGGDEGREAVPVRAAFLNPMIGKDCAHGT